MNNIITPLKTMVSAICSRCNKKHKTKITGLQSFKNGTSSNGSFLNQYLSNGKQETDRKRTSNFNICKKCKKIRKQKDRKMPIEFIKAPNIYTLLKKDETKRNEK